MTLLEKLKTYRRLKKEIGMEFGQACWDDIEDHTHEYFTVTSNTLRFDNEKYDDPEESTYLEDLIPNSVRRKEGLVLLTIRTSTGDGNVSMIFDESMEVKDNG